MNYNIRRICGKIRNCAQHRLWSDMYKWICGKSEIPRSTRTSNEAHSAVVLWCCGVSTEDVAIILARITFHTCACACACVRVGGWERTGSRARRRNEFILILQCFITSQ